MFVTIKKSLFVLSTLLLAVGCDTADDDSATRVREVVAGAEVSLVQAIDAAVAAVPAGVVIEAELEVEAATPIYEVRMLADDTLTKIHVDPATGEVRLPSGQVLRSKPFSERMVQIWQAGGTIPLLEREFAARRAAASGQGNAT